MGWVVCWVWLVGSLWFKSLGKLNLVVDGGGGGGVFVFF